MSQLRFHVKKNPAVTESLKTAELKRVRALPKEQITKLPICCSAAGASTPGGGLLSPPAPGQQPPQTASSVLRRLLMQRAGGRKAVFHRNRRSLLDPSSELLPSSPVVSWGLSTLGAGHRQKLLPWDSTCPAKNEPERSDFLARVLSHDPFQHPFHWCLITARDGGSRPPRTALPNLPRSVRDPHDTSRAELKVSEKILVLSGWVPPIPTYNVCVLFS